jgi:hypothetical protein
MMPSWPESGSGMTSGGPSRRNSGSERTSVREAPSKPIKFLVGQAHHERHHALSLRPEHVERHCSLVSERLLQQLGLSAKMALQLALGERQFRFLRRFNGSTAILSAQEARKLRQIPSNQ